jgi:hypothetical protein
MACDRLDTVTRISGRRSLTIRSLERLGKVNSKSPVRYEAVSTVTRTDFAVVFSAEKFFWRILEGAHVTLVLLYRAQHQRSVCTAVR